MFLCCCFDLKSIVIYFNLILCSKSSWLSIFIVWQICYFVIFRAINISCYSYSINNLCFFSWYMYLFWYFICVFLLLFMTQICLAYFEMKSLYFYSHTTTLLPITLPAVSTAFSIIPFEAVLIIFATDVLALSRHFSLYLLLFTYILINIFRKK